MSNNKNIIGDFKNSNNNKVNQIIIENQNIINVNGSDKFLEIICSHPLFPFYTVDFKKDSNGIYKSYSKPTCEEAKTIYPVNYKGSFSVVDERYKDITNKKLLIDRLKYADSPVEVKITDLKQYLGDVLDPYYNSELNNNTLKSYIIPEQKKLPNIHFKVNFMFKGSKYSYNDIIFRLTKQISSEEFIFDNYEQKNKPILIQLNQYYDGKKHFYKMNYEINKEFINSSEAKLEFDKFCLNIMTKSYYFLDVKNNKSTSLVRNEEKYTLEEIDYITNHMHIMERIIEIEKYFNIKFNVPDKLENDIKEISQLYTYIQGSKKRIKTLDCHFKTLKKYIIIDKLEKLVNLPRFFIQTVTNDIVFNIFGTDIKVKKIIQRFGNLKCSNIDEINEFIEKFNVLPDDYEVNIIFIPAKKKYIFIQTEIDI